MKKQIKIISLCAALLLSAVIALSALTVPLSAISFDLSRPGSQFNSVIYAGDVLDTVLHEPPSAAEREYLSLYAGFSLTYPSNVPTSYVKTEYDSNTQILTVDAFAYSYNSESGVNVVWTPVSVTLGELSALPTYLPEEGLYRAEFSSITDVEEMSARVDYESDFSVSKETVNSFINLAFDDANYYKSYIEEKNAEYLLAKEKYDSDLSQYENYLKALSEYEAALEIYDQYILDLRLYEEQNKEYLAYLEKLRQYEIDKAEYDKYVLALDKYNSDYSLYLEYVDYESKNRSKIEAYNKYIVEIEKARAHLRVMEEMKTKLTYLERSVYGAIKGDTVTAVTANKDAVMKLVADSPDKDKLELAIDNAGAATANLRAMLGDYFALETEEAQYSYYVLNYEKIRDNYIVLLQSLDKLYVKKIRGVLDSQDKLEKYVILLAQLYYTVNALSDEPVLNFDKTAYFDSGYVIGKGFKEQALPKDVLNSPEYMIDRDSAQPLANGYPRAVEEPLFKEPVPEPQKPVFVSKPSCPDEVKEPSEPSSVSEPVKPREVTDPGTAPKEYVPPEGVLEIIDALDSGLLLEREDVTRGCEIKLTVSAVKRIEGAEEVSVAYFGKDGELLYEITVERGTFADYGGPLQTKPEDNAATYSFGGWQDAEGNIPDLSRVESDLMLYPYFIPTFKKYPVTWVVDGEEKVDLVTYGEVPEYVGEPQKEDVKDGYFVFMGWNTPPTAVVGEASYTALFEKRYFIPFVNGGGADITTEDGTVIADCTSNHENQFKIDALLDKISGDSALLLKMGNADILFAYSEVIAMHKSGVAYVGMSVLMRGTEGYSYSLNLMDADKNTLKTEHKASVSIPFLITDISHLSLYYNSSGERVPIGNTVSDGRISFLAVSGREYEASLDYTVSTQIGGAVEITLDYSEVKVGKSINVALKVPDGITVTSLYYLNEAQERFEIENYSFIMPRSSVTVGVEYEYNNYTVTFVSDGKTVATYVCLFGEEIIPPEDPKKANDEKYSYEFIGWSKEITPVTESTSYTALYKATLLPVDIKDGPKITDSVMKIIVLGISLLILVFLIIIPSSVMTVVLFVKRRKKQINVIKNNVKT